MEELHKIHKDVPFGYWVEWLAPAFRRLRARRAAPRVAGPARIDRRRQTA